MSWPGITDFSEAVQNPRLCFKGTGLEHGDVSLNQRGMPLVFSGAFACVYPVSVGNQTFAVRCFTREVSDQQARYGELSSYLLNVLPPSFVHFEYVEHGISVRGGWYPIVKMEWVDGELLSRFVGSRINQPDTLRRAAAQWRGGPTASLRGLRIAHNDLQHGNVLVQRDGSIRLVDYDGMFLPRFRGERSPELGHKNYQHPERSAEHYDENVDNFSSLVIYISLLAIAADPGLWEFHDEDNLIFTRNDYADPRGSEIFGRLKRSPDQAVGRLAERLEEYCALPLEKVPDLEAVLQDIPPSAAPPPSVSPPAAAAPPTPPPTGRRPSTPQPAAPAQAVRPAGARPAPPGQSKRCPSCNTANSTTAVVCSICGASMAGPMARRPLPGSPPGPPPPAVSPPAVSLKDTLRQIERAAGICVSALKRSAASGELRTVAVRAVAAVFVINAVMVALVALAVALHGW